MTEPTDLPAIDLPAEVLARIAPDQRRQLLALRGLVGPKGFFGIADLAERRRRFEEVSAFAASQAPGPEVVTRQDLTLPGLGDTRLPARLYRPAAATGALPALLYLHGGGGIMGSLYSDDPHAARLCVEAGVAVLSLGYTLAPEARGAQPARETLAALDWLARAEGIDPARLALGGASAGAGIAAGAALLGRERDLPALSLLLLLYPMLDDRTRSGPGPETGIWGAAANIEAWDLRRSGDDTEPGFAAARAADLRGLPPVYTDVGDLDLFLPEILDFTFRLAGDGVPVECHVHPGCCHGFDRLAPRAAASRAVHSTRAAALRRALFPELQDQD